MPHNSNHRSRLIHLQNWRKAVSMLKGTLLSMKKVRDQSRPIRDGKWCLGKLMIRQNSRLVSPCCHRALSSRSWKINNRFLAAWRSEIIDSVIIKAPRCLKNTTISLAIKTTYAFSKNISKIWRYLLRILIMIPNLTAKDSRVIILRVVYRAKLASHRLNCSTPSS